MESDNVPENYKDTRATPDDWCSSGVFVVFWYVVTIRDITKDQGHYVAITKRGNEWISHIDAKVAQTTLSQLHQTQAYIMIYRKMDHVETTGINGPRDSTMAGQQLTAKKFKLSHKTEHSPEESLLHPDPLTKIPEKKLPRQK